MSAAQAGITRLPEPPVILAVRRGLSLRFHCGWCRSWHAHSVHGSCDSCGCELHDNLWGPGPCTCPSGSGNGHRVAHCTSPRSPYRSTGYVLREVAA